MYNDTQYSVSDASRCTCFRIHMLVVLGEFDCEQESDAHRRCASDHGEGGRRKSCNDVCRASTVGLLEVRDCAQMQDSGLLPRYLKHVYIPSNATRKMLLS